MGTTTESVIYVVFFFLFFFPKAGEHINVLLPNPRLSFTVCLNTVLLALEGQRENDPFLFSTYIVYFFFRVFVPSSHTVICIQHPL